MSKVRAWLRLFRVAALPTALADVWLGAAVVDGLRTWDLAGLSLVSLGLYAAGMVLNDVSDVRADTRDNPSRPLPSGAIRVGHAATFGFGLLAAAVAGAALLGGRAAAVAGILAVLIVTYDFVWKGTAVGPVNMGLCRACNVVLGMACVAPGRMHEAFTGLKAAAPVFVYVTAVTALSRYEARAERPTRGELLGPTLGIALAVALLPVLLAQECSVRFQALSPRGVRLLAGLGAPVLAVVGGLLAVVLVRIWRGDAVRRAVSVLLIGIVPLQALVALAHLRVVAMLVILALLVPLFALRKLSHVT
jgi:4-hydroxybenzoate polyprenyltransferase